jgi:hypothetical protein
VQFFLLAMLISVRPQGSRLLRQTVGAALGLGTAVIPILVVNALLGGLASLPSLFRGIGAVFLAMFAANGIVFGAGLARITESASPPPNTVS